MGLASTTRGFAFAVTEGPENLIDWGSHRISSKSNLIAALNVVIKRSRPLFVAAEMTRLSGKSERGRIFGEALKSVCAEHGLMILCVERRCVDAEGRKVTVTNHDLATAVAERFDVIAGRLPKRRQLWQGASDSMGIFIATSAAVAGWNHFRS